MPEANAIALVIVAVLVFVIGGLATWKLARAMGRRWREDGKPLHRDWMIALLFGALAGYVGAGMVIAGLAFVMGAG